jgi:hypothetical protein
MSPGVSMEKSAEFPSEKTERITFGTTPSSFAVKRKFLAYHSKLSLLTVPWLYNPQPILVS